MPKFTIVCQGDWIEVWEAEGPDEETVLRQEAERIIESYNDTHDNFRIDPAGVTGQWTPNRQLVIQSRALSDEWDGIDCTLTIPARG